MHVQSSLLSCLMAGVALGADIFVSPTGTGTGTIGSPFGSIQSAVNAAAAGDTIYLRAGTYRPSANIQVGKSGSRNSPIRVRPYGTEKVIIDGENMPGYEDNMTTAHQVRVDRMLNTRTEHPRDSTRRCQTPSEESSIFRMLNTGLSMISSAYKSHRSKNEGNDLHCGDRLINGPYGIYARDASHNWYERLSTHDNYETGFQLEGASSNNTVTYLDSYRNRDPRKNGESADGFACKSGSGTGNVLRNARLWDNVDDGLDLFMFGSPVTIEEVYAWGNGYNRWNFSPFEGDGNGFKLGITDNPPANHIVRNSMAFSNFKKGFIDNGNPGSLTFERNTAWANGDLGVQMRSSSSSVKNNVAATNKGSSQVSLIDKVSQSGNSWNIGGTWNDGSFLSVDTSAIKGPRESNGRVKGSNFLIPTGGRAIGATTLQDV